MKPKEQSIEYDGDKKRENTGEEKTFWESHIHAYQQTNKNRKAYCRERNINYASFNYWYHKKNSSSTAKVIPITLKESLPTNNHSMLCTLKLNTGQHLVIHDHSVLDLLLGRLL